MVTARAPCFLAINTRLYIYEYNYGQTRFHGAKYYRTAHSGQKCNSNWTKYTNNYVKNKIFGTRYYFIYYSTYIG